MIVQVPAGFITLSSRYTGVALTTATIAIPSAVENFGTALVHVPHQFAALTSLITPGASGIVTLPPGKSFVAGTTSGIERLGASSSPSPFIGGAGREVVTGGSTLLLRVAGMILG